VNEKSGPEGPLDCQKKILTIAAVAPITAAAAIKGAIMV
jgi:hypothetical protein